MVGVNAFLSKVEEIRAEQPRYRLGGDGSDGTCDCIGLIIGALRRSGETWKHTHGSNYAARNQMQSIRRVKSAEELHVGEVVYKALDMMDDNWDLPASYADDPDQNDYYHVGVVTSVEPLIITHCTAPTVKQDTKLGRWEFAGKLKKVDYGESEGIVMAEGKKAVIDRPAGVTGNTVNVRSGAGKSYGKIGTVCFGDRVDVVKDLGEWCFIQAGPLSGYVMSNFILYDGEPDTGDDADGLTEEDRETLRQAMDRMAEALDLIGTIVGRG